MNNYIIKIASSITTQSLLKLAEDRREYSGNGALLGAGLGSVLAPSLHGTWKIHYKQANLENSEPYFSTIQSDLPFWRRPSTLHLVGHSLLGGLLGGEVAERTFTADPTLSEEENKMRRYQRAVTGRTIGVPLGALISKIIDRQGSLALPVIRPVV